MKNWIKKGKCKRCGKCCQEKFLLETLPFMAKMILTIYARITCGIKLKLDEIVCPFLRWEKDQAVCNVYKNRPYFCRIYPENPLDRVEGCGFYFVERR